MVLVLALGACGTKTTTTTATGPQYGGTLRIIMTGSPLSFYPPEVASPESWYEPVPCIENLVRFDETGQAQPFLCQSFVEDPTAKTVTFKLRPGVMFHD